MLLGGVVGILRTELHKFFASAVNPSVTAKPCQLPLHRGAKVSKVLAADNPCH